MKRSGWHRKRVTPAEVARTAKYQSQAHREAKKAGRLLVASGEGRCWRCGKPILPGMAWHVGHDDVHTDVIRGIEHKRCNLHAAAVKGARVKNARYGRQRPGGASNLDW